MSAVAALPRLSDNPRYRWSVFSRVLAAVVGGYALTWLFSVTQTLLLYRMGVARADAALAAMLCSFLVYAVVAMAIFHARSAARAWLWLTLAVIPLGLTVMLIAPDAAR